MQKQIEIRHNGYHGIKIARCHVDAREGVQAAEATYYPISDAVAKRLNRVACGCTGCACGERIAVQGYEIGAPVSEGWYVREGDHRGNYPQA